MEQLPLSDARALVCTEAPMAEAKTALGAPEVGTRIEVYWTGMRAWYLGRVLPLQEEDEEGSMRVAYDDGEELLHPLTERWRAEGASDSEEGAEARRRSRDRQTRKPRATAKTTASTTCRDRTCDWCGMCGPAAA